MLETPRSSAWILEAAQYKEHLDLFDLSDREKADLIKALYILAVTVIESGEVLVGNKAGDRLKDAFNIGSVIDCQSSNATQGIGPVTDGR